MVGSATITVYVGLGSNVGDRAANIASAIERLRDTPGVVVAAVSSLIETDAVGGPAESPPYLNGAATLQTSLPPHELLRALLAIEAGLGRVRLERWGPRTLDLDLLLYGDQVICTGELTVPHPLMHTRRFVLQPLAEIAANVIHPGAGLPIAALLDALT